VLRSVPSRIAALPVAAKILLAVAALIVLGLSVLLSPLLAVLATLVLTVAVFALVIQLLRRGSLRRWRIVAGVALVLVLVFSGISNALYFRGDQEQAISPEPTQEQQAPARPEKTTEKATEQIAEQTREESEQSVATAKKEDEDFAVSQPRVKKQEPPQEPERQAPPPPSPEDKLAELGKVVSVSRVVDGDTIEVSPTTGGIADVRLIGVDTPETYGGTEPYGKEASTFTTQRLEGKRWPSSSTWSG
jgi:micrococcal nuclease